MYPFTLNWKVSCTSNNFMKWNTELHTGNGIKLLYLYRTLGQMIKMLFRPNFQNLTLETYFITPCHLNWNFNFWRETWAKEILLLRLWSVCHFIVTCSVFIFICCYHLMSSICIARRAVLWPAMTKFMPGNQPNLFRKSWVMTLWIVECP